MHLLPIFCYLHSSTVYHRPTLLRTKTKNMASAQCNDQQSDVDEMMAALDRATHIISCYGIPMVLKAVIELGVLDIIHDAGPGCQLTPAEIVSKIGTSAAANLQAPAVLDRLLRCMACHSVLTCSTVAMGEGGRVEGRYGLSPVGKYFASGKHGPSLAPLLLMNLHKANNDSWHELKYAVLDGVVPFKKIHGMSQFEYQESDPELGSNFNKSMSMTCSSIVTTVLESYTGFQSVKKLVDVGGGTGDALSRILTKYPHIQGINFDLPGVISDAPTIPGVEHTGGDMFDSIPNADAILLKWILHNWNDEDCLKLLKNCLKTLPNSGKVIIVEYILSEAPEADALNQKISLLDICMLTYLGGKERTEKEFQFLAKEAGFSGFKTIPCAHGFTVMELLK